MILDWITEQIRQRFQAKGTKKPAPVAVRNVSGISVTEQAAFSLSAIWSCLFIISETIGGLPLNVYRRTDNGKIVDKEFWLYNLLHHSPNADMTPIDFISFVTGSMAFRGNAFIKIGHVGEDIVALTPLDPALCEVSREGLNKNYTYNNPFTGKKEGYKEEDIIQIGGFGYNGMTGYSLFDYARNSMGISIAGENAAGKAYRDSMTVQGSLETEQKLTKEQREEYVESFKELKDSSNTVMVLGSGLKFKPFTVSPAEMQMLENRKFNVEEIARWFGVPPMLVGLTEKNTSWGSGIEQQDLSFLKYRLSSYLIRIQQAFNKKLIPPELREEYFCEFNINALLRTDSKSRSEYYSTALQNGWLDSNEVRDLENYEPRPGGDKLRVQVNMIPLEKLGETSGTK